MKDRSRGRKGDQKGAQKHAEGGHGERTEQAIRAELKSSTGRDDDQEIISRNPTPGRHKIYEDRQQHDEADKNSEKNRLARDAGAGRTPATPVRPVPRNPSSR